MLSGHGLRSLLTPNQKNFSVFSSGGDGHCFFHNLSPDPSETNSTHGRHTRLEPGATTLQATTGWAQRNCSSSWNWEGSVGTLELSLPDTKWRPDKPEAVAEACTQKHSFRFYPCLPGGPGIGQTFPESRVMAQDTEQNPGHENPTLGCHSRYGPRLQLQQLNKCQGDGIRIKVEGSIFFKGSAHQWATWFHHHCEAPGIMALPGTQGICVISSKQSKRV